MKRSSETGPTGDPKCPHCGNSFQTATPHGSPNLRLCATCKEVWEFMEPRSLLRQIIDGLEVVRRDEKSIGMGSRLAVSRAIRYLEDLEKKEKTG